jgi:hypothetical protein
MTRHTPQQKIREAKQIAQDHNCFVVEKAGEYQLFRKMAARNVFVGQRNSPAALLTLVCKATNFH